MFFYFFFLSRPILCLPHPSSLANWLSNMHVEPGFLSNVFDRLKLLDDDKKDCNMVIDAMAIRKQIVYNQAKRMFDGLCDFGQYLEVEASDVPATEALVIMLVGLKHAWKWPIAYFLQNKSSASLQKTLIESAIQLSNQAGLRVHGITFDGTSTNLATFNSFGCNFHGQLTDVNSKFIFNSQVFHAIPDPCHMLKLARNCLATYTKLNSPNGIIDWSYITKLHSVQENIGFKFANNLSRTHIEWKLNTMKVKLAAQTLSKSVADALEFLCLEKVCEFEGVEETVKFIRSIDKLFDFLNSTSPWNKGFKAGITLQNIDTFEEEIMDILNYLYTLRTMEGVPLYMSLRKTFVVGFAAAVKSVLTISKYLLNSTSFKFVLSYKFSQDHLETFFSKIRARHGFNNNPNVQQFKWALQQILLHNEILASAVGNSLYVDNDPSGSIFEIQWRKKDVDVDYENVGEEDDNICEEEHLLLQSSSNDKLKDNILYYISGFIVRKILKKVNCLNCKLGLIENTTDHTYMLPDEYTHLVHVKDLGGLIRVSKDVFRVVSESERTLLVTNFKFNDPKSHTKLTISVKNNLAAESIFSSCEESSNLRCHKLEIIKMIANYYFKIRLHSIAKTKTMEVNVTSKRHWRNKLTLFFNQ